KISYAQPLVAGTAKVTVTGLGSYTGTVTATYKILKAKVQVPTAKTGLTYNGAAQTGTTAAKANGLGTTYQLVSGTEASATSAGSHTAKYTLKDTKNYTWADGTSTAKSVKWTIARANLKNATVAAIKAQDFTGETLKPAPVVKMTVTQGSGTAAGKKTLTLKSGTDYTVSYKNNVNPGTATVTITGKGNYTGTVSKTFTIVKPKAEYQRDAGDNRYQTSLAIADEYRALSGGGKLATVVIADGVNYPDALAGAYLAAAKKAPIVATTAAQTDNTFTYVKNNLKAGGQVYILGGTGSVSAALENKLKTAGFKVSRLGGSNRYQTNILALQAAKVATGQEFIVTTGGDFADALSASATGKPVLLVAGNKLTAEQSAYLAKVKPSRFTIVGTETQVTAAIQQELAGLASVRRITGADAYVRSVNIAKTFFTGNQPHINLASGLNPADGLCGGPMAVLKGGPLILTDNTATVNNRIAAYAKAANTIRATVFGGAGSVADSTVKTILAIN
ncbi:MAG: cell wall-binding repeat-containing protein, partial [Firmicutes bacterium]|nr:cell wall-binding repeat-containing protein [Bacillota bacterium]